MPTRRLVLYLACIASLVVPAPASAQAAFPTRPVTLVVPFPPGGGTDTGGRILAEQLGKLWGQTVVVENKGGAAGQIGADLVAKAKPDGYTLLLGNIGTQAINPSLYSKLPYDPDTAFAPIALIAELPLALMVNPTVPANTAAELIALAKSRPGQLSYSSAGSGGGATPGGRTVQGSHWQLHPACAVPWRRPGAVGPDRRPCAAVLPDRCWRRSGHIKSGKLRALAVTGERRVPALPDVPTLAETVLPGFNAISWLGVLAPAGTPKEIVAKIAADIRGVMADEAVKARFASLGGVPRTTSPQDFAKLIAADRARYAQIITSRKITVD